MDKIKVETLTDDEQNWEPCFDIKNEEDIPIEYVQIEKIDCKSPEKRRTVIVPKSELGSEYDYIREADITLCESTIEIDGSTGAVCEICTTTVSQSSKQRSVKQQSEMCNKCCTKNLPKGALPQRKLEQKKHKQSIRGTTKTFKCELSKCAKTYSSQQALNSHKLSHTGEKPFECEKCYKKFRTQANLYNHRTTHADVKPFECYECSYKCHRVPTLKRHMLIHTGEMPHQCDQCTHKFREIGGLRKHKLSTHMSPTGQKLFECQQCQKKYYTAKGLMQHMQLKQHSGIWECDYCSTKCRNKVDLINHMKIHVPNCQTK